MCETATEFCSKIPHTPLPPDVRCRRAGIDTRTVDYKARFKGGDADHDRNYDDNDGIANSSEEGATICVGTQTPTNETTIQNADWYRCTAKLHTLQ